MHEYLFYTFIPYFENTDLDRIKPAPIDASLSIDDAAEIIFHSETDKDQRLTEFKIQLHPTDMTNRALSCTRLSK